MAFYSCACLVQECGHVNVFAKPYSTFLNILVLSSCMKEVHICLY